MTTLIKFSSLAFGVFRQDENSEPNCPDLKTKEVELLLYVKNNTTRFTMSQDVYTIIFPIFILGANAEMSCNSSSHFHYAIFT